MSLSLSSRFVTSAALLVTTTAGALALGLAAPVAANAATTCGGSTVVDRPGEHAVANAPAHHGQITLGMQTPAAKAQVDGWWQFSLDEYNGTGAPYRNVAVEPILYGWTTVGPGKLGGMTPQNTRLQAQVDGVWQDVPLRGSCDPEMVVNSTVVDHALAAGEHRSIALRLKVDASVAPQLRSFTLTDAVVADGARQMLRNTVAVGLDRPVADPAPAAGASQQAAPVAVASAPATGAPSAAPSAAPSGQPIAAAPAAHSSSNGTLLGIGAALLAAAALVGVGVTRKVRRPRA